MLNNRGQMLIIFILILPILLLMFAVVVDTGYLYIEMRKIENNIKDAIEYRFSSNLTDNEIVLNIEEKLKKMVNNPTINITNNYIEIKIDEEKESLFSNIVSSSKYKIKMSYVGTLDNEKVKIRKG